MQKVYLIKLSQWCTMFHSISYHEVVTFTVLFFFYYMLTNLLGVVPLTATNYGQGSMASATVEFVECDGTEKRLVDCTIRDGPNSQCTHSGVQCRKYHNPDIIIAITWVLIYLCSLS